MRYKYADMQEVKLPAVLYSIELYVTEPTDNDIKAFKNALRYQQQKEPFISWFVAVSDTESDTAVKTKKKTGKPGRPKTVVTGSKVEKHVHVGVIGDKAHSAYSAAKRVGSSMNKRFGKKATRVIAMQGAGFIAYSYKQANSFQTGGDFDFSQYKEPVLW